MKPYFSTLFPHVSNFGTTAGPEYKLRTNKTVKKKTNNRHTAEGRMSLGDLKNQN